MPSSKLESLPTELLLLDGDEYVGGLIDDPSGTPTSAKLAIRGLGEIGFSKRNRSYNLTWIGAWNGSLVQIGPTFAQTANSAVTKNFATTNTLTRRKRYAILSAATSGSATEMRAGGDMFARSGSFGAGYEGFRTLHRFAITTMPATWRAFAGVTGTLGTSADPSTLTNIIGMAKDVADTSWQIISNDGTGTATKIALDNVQFPINDVTALFEFELYCPPGTSNVTYWVRKISGVDANGNDTYSAVATGTISSDLPATTTLRQTIWAQNDVNNAAVEITFCRLYSESFGGAT